MVKTALFPLYTHAQKLIKTLEGKQEEVFKGMRKSIFDRIGTPQAQEDWSNPEEWIMKRLSGEEQKFAISIWEETNHDVNPRHTSGIWYLMNGYNLIKTEQGIYKLTDEGKKFLNGIDNEVIRKIDKEEGCVFILYLCTLYSNSSRKAFLKDWKEYLRNNSNYKEDTVVKDSLRRRLANLLSRDLVTRDGNKYNITESGKKYLSKFKDVINSPSMTEETKLNQEMQKFNHIQKEVLRKELQKMDPYKFEFLVKELLDSMGYEDVQVTAPSNDKGVDVIGTIQNGITNITEVIQVKRLSSNVQRPVLDALRGSLHRFNAVKGTIITISDFSIGTREAAFERGAAPITLINGDKLIDLLIENEIGINKKHFDYYTVDLDYFKIPTEEET